MLQSRLYFTLAILLNIMLLIPAKSNAEYLTIRIPAYTDTPRDYSYELLAAALAQEGHLAAIEKVMDIPHLRERDMLKNGEIDILGLIRSKELDAMYLPVPVNLTKGLIGKRILLVPRANVEDYAEVKTLGDFRRLGKVGGFGKGWFDVSVWDKNNLPYVEVADWRLLYAIIADGTRDIDYLSRSFNEIVTEADTHPELAIEPHLMLSYERDFIFYVSPKKPELVPKLEKALKEAEESGLMDALIKKHWTSTYDRIKPEARTVIELRLPK